MAKQTEAAAGAAKEEKKPAATKATAAKAEAKPSASAEDLAAELHSVKRQLAQLIAQQNAARDNPNREEQIFEADPDLKVIRSERLDCEKALEKIRKNWSRNSEAPMPTEVVGKAYQVTAGGAAGSKFPPLIVENCSDGGDALAAFYNNYGVPGFKIHATAKRVA